MFKKLFKNLAGKPVTSGSPEAMARVVSDEWWRIVDDATNGKNVTNQAAAFRLWAEDRIRSISPADMTRYLEKRNECDNRQWIDRFFSAVLDSIDRDETFANIALQSLKMNHQLITGKLKVSDFTESDLKTLKDTMQRVWAAREQVRTTRKQIAEEPFWDLWGIPKPAKLTAGEVSH